ncbi:MAG: DUF1735 domain-containing protein [Bacteroidales bacterium]|nr:DUF1735 domain-containing protein [Bacteroidales bacterium]
MKKTISILIAGIVAFGCSNMDIEFDDFDYQSIYFPYQTPVRTIILGDESIGDNTIDLEHAFSIGVSLGGAYENNKNRIVSVEYAPELGENIKYLNDKDTLGLEVLPAAYYEAVFDQIIIPSGEFSGKMRVDLKDAFFNDPLSATTHYVIPTRITDAAEDSVLSGDPNDFVDDPDPRIDEDWDIVPKDYTLFGIKYINETHGMYLLRGSRINSSTGEEVTYSERFLVDNNMTKLSTLSLTENVMDVVGGTFTGNFYTILLTFNKDNKTVTVSSVDASTAVVSGTGVYYTKDDSEAESFNGSKHRTIYLDYTVFSSGKDYYIKDSLVFADTDVMFEEFNVLVVDP